MSQHDFDIANQTSSDTRADINLALKALASQSSGTSAPTTTYANMMWYDTTNNLLRMRNEADSAWITLGTLDQVANTFSVPAATNATNLTGTATSNIQTSSLATGTASSSTFLRGDRTWQTINVDPTTSQVLAATAGMTANAIGSLSNMQSTRSSGTLTNYEINAIVNGSGLTFSNSDGSVTFSGPGSSTWRTLGPFRDGTGSTLGERTTLMVRVT